MHPAIGLVVIDTLQRIRAAGNKTNPYYQDIGVLKDLADRHYIAVLLIHHRLEWRHRLQLRAPQAQAGRERRHPLLYRPGHHLPGAIPGVRW